MAVYFFHAPRLSILAAGSSARLRPPRRGNSADRSGASLRIRLQAPTQRAGYLLARNAERHYRQRRYLQSIEIGDSTRLALSRTMFICS